MSMRFIGHRRAKLKQYLVPQTNASCLVFVLCPLQALNRANIPVVIGVVKRANFPKECRKDDRADVG